MLDFDGTLYPYATAVALAVAHLSGGKVAPDPAVLPDYDLVSSWGRKFGMTAALWDEAHLLIARDSAFHDMEPIPGSAAAVRRFRSAGGTVVIQTVRAGFTSERPHARPDDGARIAAATEQWACDWFAVPPDAVIHVSTAGRKGRSH
ncbi:MAG TPA: hypothetical protein DEP66_01905, partial [Acidimicrobiaceae bacterium]|nr:hypothetical protein [Acidimicrobiaceae bacterium]